MRQNTVLYTKHSTKEKPVILRMYVYMYVCMYVYMYVCMYVCSEGKTTRQFYEV